MDLEPQSGGTETTHRRCKRSDDHRKNNLTDAEWSVIEPLLPKQGKAPRKGPACAREHRPALCAGPVVPSQMASRYGNRRCDHRALWRRLCCRLAVPQRGDTFPARSEGMVGAVWLEAACEEDPRSRIRTVRVCEPEGAGRSETFDFLGILRQDPEGRLLRRTQAGGQAHPSAAVAGPS